MESHNQKTLKQVYLIGNYMKFLKYIKSNKVCTAKLERSGGFAILYTMMIIAIAMALSMGIIDLIMNQRSLSNIARESLASRSAADVGLECILYLDKLTVNGSNFDYANTNARTNIDCGKDLAGTAINYTITRVGTTGYVYTVSTTSSASSIDGPCFNAYYTHTLAPLETKIDIFGYNKCNPSDPIRAERGIIAQY